MCTGNTALPVQAVHRTLRADRKQERQQLRRQEERQAEYDAIAERRTAKQEAFAAERKEIRQDARAQQDVLASNQYDANQLQGAPASTAVQSVQATAGQNSGSQAPTAVLSGKKGRKAGAKGSSSSLRIGPASSGAGVGPNIAV